MLGFGNASVASEVARLRTEVSALCSALDPASVPLGEVDSIWSGFDDLERLASGAKCRLAARVEQSHAWKRQGARSPAESLAQRGGTTTGRARAALETSKALANLAEVDAAVAAGELSEQQATAITAASSADPSAQSRLLSLARRRDLRRLREECARIQARAEDEAERAKRLYRQRSLRTWTGADGSWNLSVRNTPEVGAELEAALAPLKEAVFAAARRRGDRETGEAYAADALAELVRQAVGAQGGARGRAPGGSGDAPGREPGGSGPGGERNGDGGEGEPGEAGEPGGDDDALAERAAPRSRRPDTKVIVRIDYEALKRGWSEATETCEIAGLGPVSVATVRSLLSDAFGAAVVTDGVDTFTVAHLGRSVTAHQRSALEYRGYHCEVPGCGATTALEIDHTDEWIKTFRTSLDRLAWLCRVHHLDKTHGGWRLEGPPGRRRWQRPQTDSGDGGGGSGNGDGMAAADGPSPEPPPDANGEARSLFGDPAA